MEQIQITQENGIITIGNVVLTKEAISTLEFLQEDESGSLKTRLEELAEAICILAVAVEGYNGIFKTPIYEAITNLAYIRTNLKDLAKPSKTQQTI